MRTNDQRPRANAKALLALALTGAALVALVAGADFAIEGTSEGLVLAKAHIVGWG